MVGRGNLTEKIQSIAKEAIGREISVKELRLMAYVQYVAMNERAIDKRKINEEEEDILIDWTSQGWISHIDEKMEVSKKFWDLISDCVYEAYVIFDLSLAVPPSQKGEGIPA